MTLKRMIKLLKEYLKSENRDNLYKKNNHVPMLYYLNIHLNQFQMILLN